MKLPLSLPELTYPELYEALYGKDKDNLERARYQVTHLSDDEWHEWIEYRENRRKTWIGRTS